MKYRVLLKVQTFKVKIIAGFHEPSALARANATRLGANARDSVASELVTTKFSKTQNFKFNFYWISVYWSIDQKTFLRMSSRALKGSVEVY
jgi:hypothetical protein